MKLKAAYGFQCDKIYSKLFVRTISKDKYK